MSGLNFLTVAAAFCRRNARRAGGALWFWAGVRALAGLQYFDSPGTYPHGLTTDGTNLWNADDAGQVIYQLNATGAVTGSFAFSYGNPRGLAYTNGVLFVATGSRRSIPAAR